MMDTADPDATLAHKGNGTRAVVGYTVNGLMENRHRPLLGITVESFRGPASEMEDERAMLDTFHAKHERLIQAIEAAKRYGAKSFLTALFRGHIQPHIAANTTWREQGIAGWLGQRATAARTGHGRRSKNCEARSHAGTASGAFRGVDSCKSEIKLT
jgi:hypothetical protein